MQNNLNNNVWAYKLMSEVMEIEAEITLKKKQVANRMEMLKQIQKMQPNPQLQQFLLSVDQKKQRRPSLDCEKLQEPIPMPSGDLYDPIPMKMEELFPPIPMKNTN